MPTYEYKCTACGKQSLLFLRLSEHESGMIKRPKCGSSKMERIYSPFYAHTSRKS